MPDCLEFFWHRFLRLDWQDRDVNIEIRPFDRAVTRQLGEEREWFEITALGVNCAVEYLTRLSQKCTVYYGVLPRIGRGSGDKDRVKYSDCLWCDVDGGEEGVTGAVALIKRAVAVNGIPKPNAMIVSGNGVHCYWLFPYIVQMFQPTQAAMFEQVQRRLCLAIGTAKTIFEQKTGKNWECLSRADRKEYGNRFAHADPSRSEIASILRPPGTVNWKNTEHPKNVRILRLEPECDIKAIGWWQENLPTEPYDFTPDTDKQLPDKILPLPPKTKELLAHPVPNGTRHHECKNLFVSAARCGYSEDSLYAFGEQFTDVNGWDHKEMRKELIWVLQKVMFVQPSASLMSAGRA